MTGKDLVNASLAKSVLAYWQEKTSSQVRSQAVQAAYLKRIQARLQDGFSVAQLCRCVDVACWDTFYTEHGYQKQPDVIWRNAERCQKLLAKAQHEQERPLPL